MLVNFNPGEYMARKVKKITVVPVAGSRAYDLLVTSLDALLPGISNASGF